MELLRPNQFSRAEGEKWDSCVLCGSKKYRAIVHFKDATVAAKVGETITGASSGDTGIVYEAFLESGAYSAGTAKGVLILTSPAGYDDTYLEIFTDGETLTGSSTFVGVANHKGGISISGNLYSDSELVEYQGKKYCQPHFTLKWRRKFQDDEKVDVSGENERGK